MKTVYFNITVDCEATQYSIKDSALGKRSVKGLKEILDEHGLKGTFFVIPSDLEASPELYLSLKKYGHEVSLHLHPADLGYGEFLGVYGHMEQKEIMEKAMRRFEKIMGYRPFGFCSGYASANDFTYGVLEELDFRHGHISLPTRVLPECASVWSGSPLFIHYANRYNRVLEGDVDFVEIPVTLDWESRMWSGRHPQDLRVELVDAKNHWYTIEKSLAKQIETKVPVKLICATTHNLFEFGDKNNFRRQTLEEIIESTRNICTTLKCKLISASLEKIANIYRRKVPLGVGFKELKLDRRGYSNKTKS